MKDLTIADLFCGAGGTSTGATEAGEQCGYRVRLTAVNHNQIAITTHQSNHPDSRHLCTGSTTSTRAISSAKASSMSSGPARSARTTPWLAEASPSMTNRAPQPGA
jgi:site-specific DNA-cytosine methylase